MGRMGRWGQAAVQQLRNMAVMAALLRQSSKMRMQVAAVLLRTLLQCAQAGVLVDVKQLLLRQDDALRSCIAMWLCSCYSISAHISCWSLNLQLSAPLRLRGLESR